jgi:hypothetical protein
LLTDLLSLGETNLKSTEQPILGLSFLTGTQDSLLELLCLSKCATCTPSTRTAAIEGVGRIASRIALPDMAELLQIVLTDCTNILHAESAELRYTAAAALLRAMTCPLLVIRGVEPDDHLISVLIQVVSVVSAKLNDPNRYVIGYCFELLASLSIRLHPSLRVVRNLALESALTYGRTNCLYFSCVDMDMKTLTQGDQGFFVPATRYEEVLTAIGLFFPFHNCNHSTPDCQHDGCMISQQLRIDLPIEIPNFLCLARFCPYSNAKDRWCENSKQTRLECNKHRAKELVSI